MTIPPPNTKEMPGPFDAFATAKPGEPIFTLQGGDPLAAQMVRQWAEMARSNALHGSLTPAKASALLLRATEAERVSWAMDEYREGHSEVAEDRPTYNDTPPDETAKAAQDRHAALVAIVQRLDNAVAETNDAATKLRSFDMAEVAGRVQRASDILRGASGDARPARPAYMTPGRA